jgi:DNA-3-methyladenine glycosylase II
MTMVQPKSRRKAIAAVPLQSGPIEGERLAAALAELATRDADLARAIAEVGPPAPRSRPAGFASLLDIVLAQQVSTASYRAIAQRLVAAIGAVTPAGILALGEAELRAVGFSRPKTTYARGIAEAVGEGRLDLDAVARLDDEAAVAELVKLKGVGRWTAEIYLMFCLGRPDVLPAGDLALCEAARLVKGRRRRPDEAALRRMGKPWQPWRSVAARLLWHYYAVKVRRAVAPLPAAADETKTPAESQA